MPCLVGKGAEKREEKLRLSFKKRELQLGEKILLGISWAQGAIFGAVLGGLVPQLSLTGSEQQNSWKKAVTGTQLM